MLRFLKIRHLAVIDAVEVEFDPGFNVLTGETGAGKSILVGAVGLLLGGRASGDLVRTGEESAAIEAIFEQGDDELLVRREITAQGRSRAFVNGTLSTAAALKDLAAGLIELHGQHEHQTLLDPDTHLPLLDAYGDLGALAAPVASAFDAMRAAAEELARIRAAAADRESRLELIAFQLAELDGAAPSAGEDDELSAVRQVLANAERVERLCADSYAALYERDDAILAALGQVWRRVAELASLDPRFQPYLDARDGIKSQLEDLAGFFRRYADGIEASPARLQQVEDRLALLERLKRKYGPTLADVIARREALRREHADVAGGDERIRELEQRDTAARAAYAAAAAALSAPRARIVSGGELSRVMLAIKSMAATSRLGFVDGPARPPSAAPPGLIFDEVDAGIDGRVADVIGRRLRALGSAFQVLCITHLPQIAAYADTHFQIEKQVERGRTRTTVRRLDEPGRIDELARMLGGDVITDGLRRFAREMLEGRTGPPAGEGRKRKGERRKLAADPGAAT